ncbi:MAG: GNAT family N-acetyltransferase [Clostridiales bacterium]|jgi:ribosomal protein S18 acetylase RimI-like enzyme|nr:GNAT family N-acetyltransferase [Clostridiales bacterium]
MTIEIRKLTPDLVDEYIRFFDVTPHNEKHHHAKCYCVYWCSDDGEDRDFSTKTARRDCAIQYVKGNNLQGYLAYCEDKVVGWCNANTKSDCLKCQGWRGMNGKRKGFIPTEEATPEIMIKSVFCFTIAPDMRRQGIALRLLERVCRDAAEDGFDYVEAYPDKEVTAKSEDFVGHAEMYEKMGFTVYHETNRKHVMRKPLK